MGSSCLSIANHDDLLHDRDVMRCDAIRDVPLPEVLDHLQDYRAQRNLTWRNQRENIQIKCTTNYFRNNKQRDVIDRQRHNLHRLETTEGLV